MDTRHLRFAFVGLVFAGLMIGSLAGCKKEQVAEQSISEVQGPESEKQAPTQGQFDKSLELWAGGDKSQAVEVFLAIDWNSPSWFSQGSILSLTEQQFASLPAEEQQAKMPEMFTISTMIRELGKHVVKLGKESLAAKQDDAAEKQFDAVLQSGLAICSPESLAMLRMIGFAVQQMALDEQMQMYSSMGNQEKLAKTQEALKQLETAQKAFKKQMSGKK